MSGRASDATRAGPGPLEVSFTLQPGNGPDMRPPGTARTNAQKESGAGSSHQIMRSANSSESIGKKQSRRRRQVSTHPVHWAGIASRPYTAPGSAPQMALVSVSPPRMTVSTTASSRFRPWKGCRRALRNAVMVDVVGGRRDGGTLDDIRKASGRLHVGTGEHA